MLLDVITGEEIRFSSARSLSFYLGMSEKWLCEAVKSKGTKFQYRGFVITVGEL